MENEWVKDEHGNKTWTHRGWTIKQWADLWDMDITGPDGEDVYLDHREIIITHEAPYDGSVSVRVPTKVILEALKVVGY